MTGERIELCSYCKVTGKVFNYLGLKEVGCPCCGGQGTVIIASEEEQAAFAEKMVEALRNFHGVTLIDLRKDT